MELFTHVVEAVTRHSGEISDRAVAEGKRLVIETSPSGSDILDFAVPTGGVKVTIHVQIDENGP